MTIGWDISVLLLDIREIQGEISKLEQESLTELHYLDTLEKHRRRISRWTREGRAERKICEKMMRPLREDLRNGLIFKRQAEKRKLIKEVNLRVVRGNDNER